MKYKTDLQRDKNFIINELKAEGNQKGKIEILNLFIDDLFYKNYNIFKFYEKESLILLIFCLNLRLGLYE